MNLRPLAALLPIVFLSTACASLSAVSSGEIGCRDSEISITDDQVGWYTRTWTASCHGRTYFCSAHGGGKNSTAQVSCKENTATADAPRPAPATPEDEARLVCNTIYNHAREFAPYWLGRSDGGKALDPLPEARDFVAVCATLPPNIRRCMFEKYRTAHEKSCDAMLSRVDASTKNKIDSLFLEAPSASASK